MAEEKDSDKIPVGNISLFSAKQAILTLTKLSKTFPIP